MLDTTEALKFRILMCFLVSSAENCTVTGISRTLQEEKYKISRMMIRMEKDGLVDRSQVRAPSLTEKGRQVAERYRERVCIAQNHLLYEGMDLETARRDASSLALYCSDELIQITRRNDEYYRVKTELREEKSFTGATLCRRMKDGSYSLPFIIYREQMKEHNMISMANSAFEHPCTLSIQNGVGVIQLRTLGMSGKSQADGRTMWGRLEQLEYFQAGHYISAEFHGDVLTFPAEALQFINMGEGPAQILHGSVPLKMQSTCGEEHMPESKAVFTLLI